MGDDKGLKPDDFPVHAEQNKIVKNHGQTVADVRDNRIAEDIADRLNENENQREEDRWSA